MYGWTYLALSLFGLAISLNVLRPNVTGLRLSIASFVAGWLGGELALHRIATEVTVTLIYGTTTAFASTQGQIGLALTGVSWLCALYGYSLSWKAEERIESALTQVLGSDYRDTIIPELRQHLTETLDWSRILLPFSPGRKEVEVLRDIKFTEGSGIDVKLDIYRPAPGHDADLIQPAKGRPVLLQIHGGGWTLHMGDKKQQALPLMNQMASHGWICVTADYRLSPMATMPEHIIDVKHAIRWIKQEGEAYGMNSDFIVITGGSAGGHLSSLAALTPNDPTFQPGFEELDTSVYACVPFYGVFDFIDEQNQNPNAGMSIVLEKNILKGSYRDKPKEYESVSPLHRVSEAAPPFFTIHGDCDSLVPLQQARNMTARLHETSKQHAGLAVIPGGQHAFDMFSTPRSQFVVHGVERYFSWIYSRYLAEAALAEPTV